MRIKILLSSIILFVMVIIGQTSYATIEIIPSKTGDGKDAIVNVTVSDSFLYCKGMKTNTGESLKGTGIDVHLATNKDWGAVSYLSNSIYGTNGAGGDTGKSVTISGVDYYSTTTNITGVMNWGANPNVTRYTQTSGLLNTYESGNNNLTELYNNRETKYVEFIKPTVAENTKGMAMQETNGIYSSSFRTNTYINSAGSSRQGLFSGYFGVGNGGYGSDGGCGVSGAAGNSVTFRPVVWN